MQLIKGLIICFGCLGVNLALAQSKTDSLKLTQLLNLSIEELLDIKTVVSTPTPQNIFKSPSNVSVIDKDLIIQYNFKSVAEAVRIIAGIEVYQTNLDRNVATSRGILQNYYMNKVLIMINNIPTWQPIYGNGTLDRININDVERIEVLKGPASVMHGTNAYTGVINIVLHEDTKPHADVKMDVGYPTMGIIATDVCFSKKNWVFSLSGSTTSETQKPYKMRLALDSTLMNGVYFYGNDTLLNYQEKYNQNTFNFICKKNENNLFLNFFSNNYVYPGINLSFASGAGNFMEDKGTLMGYNYQKKISSKWAIGLLGNYEYFNRLYTSNPNKTTALWLSASRILGRIRSFIDVSDKFKIESSIDWQNGNSFGHYVIELTQDTIIRANMANEKNMNEISFAINPKLQYEKFGIQAGVRYTLSPNYGIDLSPRIALYYNLNNNNTLKIMYGEAFRAPTMLELYFDHPTVVGNPDLSPEENTSYELAFLHKNKYLFFQVTAYQSYYSNLIQRVRISDDITQPATYRNLSSFVGQGLEFEFKYQNIKITNAFFNYNFTTGNGTDASSNFDYVPKHTFSIGVNKNIRKLSISSNLNAYSKVKGHIRQISPQLQVDAHISYHHTLSNNLKLYHTISFRNITQSNMLIPEYIRLRPQINELATTGYGRTINYSLRLHF